MVFILTSIITISLFTNLIKLKLAVVSCYFKLNLTLLRFSLHYFNSIQSFVIIHIAIIKLIIATDWVFNFRLKNSDDLIKVLQINNSKLLLVLLVYSFIEVKISKLHILYLVLLFISLDHFNTPNPNSSLIIFTKLLILLAITH